MPSFIEIGQPVPEKIFEGFLPGFLDMAAILVWIIYIHIGFPFLYMYMLHIKFGFDWPSGFREEDL